MDFKIEEVAMPVTERKGDKRLNLIQPVLDALIQANKPNVASVHVPMENAKDERKHYVNRTNKYGRELENGAKAEFTIIAEPKGLRVWLTSYKAPEKPAEEENNGGEAPEVQTKAGK